VNIDQIKQRIIDSPEDFVDQVVLGPTARYVTDQQVNRVAKALSTQFGAHVSEDQVCAVGSAKIGFGLFEKRTKSGEVLPAFRAYRSDSDVDLAIVSPVIFDLVWDELGSHANRQHYLPWNSEKLGDYLIYGWLRPDHFPKHVRLRRCDDWWDTFRSLSADRHLGRRSVRGGLYRSFEQLRKYQLRGIEACRASLEALQ